MKFGSPRWTAVTPARSNSDERDLRSRSRAPTSCSAWALGISPSACGHPQVSRTAAEIARTNKARVYRQKAPATPRARPASPVSPGGDAPSARSLRLACARPPTRRCARGAPCRAVEQGPLGALIVRRRHHGTEPKTKAHRRALRQAAADGRAVHRRLGARCELQARLARHPQPTSLADPGINVYTSCAARSSC